jgi:hypothetical protein
VRLIPLLLLLHAAPDGEVTPEFQRDVALAMAACMDADGGVPPVRIGDCVVTCVNDLGEARLVDGGTCLPPVKIAPVQFGDFWLPGQLPLKNNKSP